MDDREIYFTRHGPNPCPHGDIWAGNSFHVRFQPKTLSAYDVIYECCPYIKSPCSCKPKVSIGTFEGIGWDQYAFQDADGVDRARPYAFEADAKQPGKCKVIVRADPM